MSNFILKVKYRDIFVNKLNFSVIKHILKFDVNIKF